MSKLSRRNFIKSAVALSSLPLVASATQTDTNHKEETLRFVHVTDSHMDLANSDSIEALELMVSYLNAKHTDLDFVLFGGDNFNNNAPKNSDALKFKEIISKLNTPAYLVRGNKESNPKNDSSINLQEFQNLFCRDKALQVVGKDWRVDTKGYTLLGLDSCIEGANNGRYSEETLSFAESVLKEKRPTIILNHHPYTNYFKGTDPKDIHKFVLNNTEETQKRLFTFDNLLLTLSGHKHIDSVINLHGTESIVTRGFIRPLDLDMYPMRLVEITNNKIQEKMIYTS